MPIRSSQTEIFGDRCRRRRTMLFREFALTQRIGITVVARSVCMRVKQSLAFEDVLTTQIFASSPEKRHQAGLLDLSVALGEGFLSPV